jgi:hypothetical protein
MGDVIIDTRHVQHSRKLYQCHNRDEHMIRCGQPYVRLYGMPDGHYQPYALILCLACAAEYGMRQPEEPAS